MLLQNILGVLAVLLVPSLWLTWSLGRGFWETGQGGSEILLALTAAYAFGAAFLNWSRRVRPLNLIDVTIVALATSGSGALVILLLGHQASRVVMALGTGLSWLLLGTIFAVKGWRTMKVSILTGTVLTATLVHVAYPLSYEPRAASSTATAQHVKSSLYTLRIRTYAGSVPRSTQSGGAVDKLWSDYLLATGDGELFRFAEDGSAGRLDAQRIALSVPTNPKEFRRAVAGLGLREEWFRVADIHTRLQDDRLTLFASYHYWHDDARCYTVRVSMFETDRTALDTDRLEGNWATLFETKPCLPIAMSDGTSFFAGLQIGGRLAMLDDRILLVTIGDHEFDGVSAPLSYSQDLSTSYGKVFAIDLDTRKVELFTLGHRNPQGLYVDPTGAVYSTEHGPEGGDELNLLKAGANYGWPVVTYGVHYGTHEWPFNPRQGAHDGYTEPLFSWVPSIAVSSLTGITNPRFGLWRGDLVVSTLRDKTLWRVRLMNGHVVLAEPIKVGVAVRDIMEGHDGQLIVWNELDRPPKILFIAEEQDETSDAALFGRCIGCHAVQDGTAHGLGPDLAGIAGRRIASSEGFSYSDALGNLDGVWTDERLEAFLEDAEKFAPGTSMRVPGISDPEHRKRIIEYLKSQR